MTDQTEAPERRVTFRNETPETSDVVLCNYCGGSLHDVEQGIFWEQTTHHYCEPAKDSRIAELEAKLATATDGLRECEEEIDDYIRQEYPHDHPVQERYRARGFAANPARATLTELKGTD